jgi:hypothetical protein
MGKKATFLPLLLMTFGVGWLLTSLGIAPRVDWVWTPNWIVKDRHRIKRLRRRFSNSGAQMLA